MLDHLRLVACVAHGVGKSRVAVPRNGRGSKRLAPASRRAAAVAGDGAAAVGTRERQHAEARVVTVVRGGQVGIEIDPARDRVYLPAFPDVDAEHAAFVATGA